jgi:hypothetical protein
LDASVISQVRPVHLMDGFINRPIASFRDG